MKENTKKSNNGITIISLVITIIILIILSMISIRLISKDDTVSNAEKVSKDYFLSEVSTKIQLAYKDLQTEQLTNLNFDEIVFLRNRLEYYGIEGATVTKEDDEYIIIVNNRKYVLNEKTGIAIVDKEISEFPEIQPNILANENSKYISDNKMAIIPAGYTISNIAAEQSIDNGLVVIDADGNEWVWIPVNDVDFAKMFVEAVDNGWTMSGTSVKTKYKSNSGIIEGINRENPGNSSQDNYREPDILVECENSFAEEMGFGSNTTLTELAKIESNDYKKMVNSLRKYKGFYIGRYEISELGVKRNKQPITDCDWYYLYGKCKRFTKDSTESRMIWGCQWDQTCKFISQYKEENQIRTRDLTNSISYGNYPGSTETGHGTLQTTGFSEAWKTNNIYDLAGNCFEWTQEACYSNCRALRGGCATENTPVLERDYDLAPGSSSIYSTRPILYIK